MREAIKRGSNNEVRGSSFYNRMKFIFMLIMLCCCMSGCTKKANIRYHKRSMNAAHSAMQESLTGQSKSHGNARAYKYHRDKLTQLGYFDARVYRIEPTNDLRRVETQEVWIANKEQFQSYPHIVCESKRVSSGFTTAFVVWDVPDRMRRWDQFFYSWCVRKGYGLVVEEVFRVRVPGKGQQ